MGCLTIEEKEQNKTGMQNKLIPYLHHKNHCQWSASEIYKKMHKNIEYTFLLNLLWDKSCKIQSMHSSR